MGAGGVDMTVAMAMKNGWIIAFVLASPVACSSSGDNDDGEPPRNYDASVPLDAGVRALCPLGSQATCSESMACGDLKPAPTNCSACIPYNRSICRLGQCETPTPLESGDPVNYLFQVGSLTTSLKSFAGFAVTAESSGGKVWTCDDVYSQKLNLTDACHNILDTRGQGIGRPDNQYKVTFTRFAASQSTLFIVYGYADEEAKGVSVGVSCKRYEVGAPGAGLTMIPGDTMRRIQ